MSLEPCQCGANIDTKQQKSYCLCNEVHVRHDRPWLFRMQQYTHLIRKFWHERDVKVTKHITMLPKRHRQHDTTTEKLRTKAESVNTLIRGSPSVIVAQRSLDFAKLVQYGPFWGRNRNAMQTFVRFKTHMDESINDLLENAYKLSDGIERNAYR